MNRYYTCDAVRMFDFVLSFFAYDWIHKNFFNGVIDRNQAEQSHNRIYIKLMIYGETIEDSSNVVQVIGTVDREELIFNKKSQIIGLCSTASGRVFINQINQKISESIKSLAHHKLFISDASFLPKIKFLRIFIISRTKLPSIFINQSSALTHPTLSIFR